MGGRVHAVSLAALLSNINPSNVTMEVSSRPVRILIIDDHPAVRGALKGALSRRPTYICSGEADSAEMAINAIRKSCPDVAIVDISLKDAHGLDLIRDIRSQYPEVKVVVYTMFGEEIFAERAIRAGALAYVEKSDPTAKVMEAIDSAVRGEVYVSRRTASRILRRLVKGEENGHISAADKLTDREMVVFQMLGQGLVVDEIADRLKLNRKTVEAYRRGAKEKLGFESVSELMYHGHDWFSSNT